MSLPPSRRASGSRTIVIGAGVVGLFCALEIARGGGNVVVIDADAAPSDAHTPRAASYAAAGMLGAFSEALQEGPRHHRRLTQLCAAGLRAWRALADTDPTLGRFVRFPGALLLAYDDADAARVRRACDRARTHDEPADFFEGLAPDLDARAFGARVKASARLPTEGVLAAEPMLAALAARAVLMGASILRGRGVVEMLADEDAVHGVALDDGGELRADRVVVATGALAPSAWRHLIPALARITPAKGMLGVARAPAAMATPEVVRSPRVYLVRDGAEVRFGATMEPGRADLDDDPDAIAALYLELRKALPGLKFAATARQASVGLRPMSPDGAPLVGASGPHGCIVAVGHGRNGWLLGPITGVAVAAMLRGEDAAPVWKPFGPERFD